MTQYRPDEEPTYECEWCLGTGTWEDDAKKRHQCDRCDGTGYRMRFDLGEYLARLRANKGRAR
jgi:DnaJ-class molecular chaperone